MKSRTTERFRKSLMALPDEVQEQARQAYRQFIQDPQHPGLRFKPVHPSRPIYSARVGRGHRALGVLDDDTVVRDWIGSHVEYDQMLKRR